MTIWHLLSSDNSFSILHRHPALSLQSTPMPCFLPPLSVPHSFSFLCGFFFFPSPELISTHNSGFIKYAGKKATRKAQTLFMLYWELTSQSNESHSSVNIRRISFHPKKRTRRSGSMERLGDAMPLRFLVLSSWNQFEHVVRRRHLGGVELERHTDERCYALQSNIFFVFFCNGCNQLAHHLRSEANSSWQGAPSLEPRCYFSCCAAFWKKVADYTTHATSHFQDIGGGEFSVAHILQSQ